MKGVEKNGTQGNIYNILCEFFHYYLTERSIEKTLAMMTDEFFFVNGQGTDFLLTKEESRQRLLHDFEVRKDNLLCFSIDKYRQLAGSEKSYICWGKLTIQSTSQASRIEPVTMSTIVGIRWDKDAYRVFFLHQAKLTEGQKKEERDLLYSKKIDVETQHLLTSVRNYMPGGMLGCYLEKGCPFDVVNQKLLDMLGYTYSELREATDGLLVNLVPAEDFKQLVQAMEKAFWAGEEYHKIHRLRRKDGSNLWVFAAGKREKTKDNKQMVLMSLIDISDNSILAEKQPDDTNKDYLTGLYNRRYARDVINDKLSRGISYGLLLLDIDKFKQLNDIYGHRIGDDVLVLVGRILKKYTRGGDVCVRLGGDEFMVFFPNLNDGEVLQIRAKQINEEFANSLNEICPQNQSDGLSIAGIYGKESATLEKLYRRTDEILYHLKECCCDQLRIEIKNYA